MAQALAITQEPERVGQRVCTPRGRTTPVAIPEVSRNWRPAKCTSLKYDGEGFYMFSNDGQSSIAWASWNMIFNAFDLSTKRRGEDVGRMSAALFDSIVTGKLTMLD